MTNGLESGLHNGLADEFNYCAKKKGSFEAETEAWWNRLSNPPSIAWKIAVNSFIKDLKTYLIWNKLDVLQLYAFENAADALLNIVKDVHNGTAYNSPTFTAKQGYKGDGSSAYINLNYNPSTDAINFALNDNSISIYVNQDSDGSNNTEAYIGHVSTNQNIIIKYIASNTVIKNNGTAYINIAITGSGYYTSSRNNSSTIDFYKDAITYAAQTMASIAVPDANIYVFGYCDSSGNMAGASCAEIGVIKIGSSLTSTDYDNFRTAFDQYLSDIAAI